MGLKEDIKGNLISLVVVDKEGFLGKIVEIEGILSEISKRAIYISLTQPYRTAMEAMRKNGVALEKYTFIDVLSSTVTNPEPDPNCFFVSSPSALTELSVAFTKVVAEKGCDSALFDSISTLTIYEDENSVIRFVHNIMTKSKVLETKVVFVSLKEDKDAGLIKDMYMFVDKVIDTASKEEMIKEIAGAKNGN